MALPNIKFNLGQGGLGRPSDSLDGISGLLFYSNALPAGFGVNDRIQKVFSVEEAEALGIVSDKSDETKATATLLFTANGQANVKATANFTVTGAGVENDNLDLSVDNGTTIVSLGIAAVPNTPTVNNVAQAIRDIVNANTLTTGYVASGAGANVIITAPTGLGTAANSYVLAVDIIGTATIGAITQFTGGVNAGTFDITVNEGAETITLCEGVSVPDSPTVNTVAAAANAAINAGTATHGYTSTVNTATVSVQPPQGRGDSANAYVIALDNNSGTTAATITQFTGGVDAFFDVMHYHISEFFRTNPSGTTLYVGIYAVPVSHDFAEVETMQLFANGEIRQIGVFIRTAFNSAHITLLDGVANDLFLAYMPLSVVYAANISGTALSALANLSLLTDYRVSACIGQDGAAAGKALYDEKGYSITCLGAMLGTISLSKVSESIAWVGAFDVNNGVELDTAAFANGVLYRSVATAQLEAMNNYKYVFLRKFIGKTGTYFSFGNTCVASNSDYNSIENVRTIDKSVRLAYAGLLDYLNSPVLVNADGTLSQDAIDIRQTAAEGSLQQMIVDTELSAFQVLINPKQNIVSTGKFTITLKLVPVGVSKEIVVNIGYTQSLS